jgi:hypothetical protein
MASEARPIRNRAERGQMPDTYEVDFAKNLENPEALWVLKCRGYNGKCPHNGTQLVLEANDVGDPVVYHLCQQCWVIYQEDKQIAESEPHCGPQY